MFLSFMLLLHVSHSGTFSYFLPRLIWNFRAQKVSNHPRSASMTRQMGENRRNTGKWTDYSMDVPTLRLIAPFCTAQFSAAHGADRKAVEKENL